MIFCSWNIRGLNQPYKQKELRFFFLKNSIDLLGCLETKIKQGKAEKIKKLLGNDWT